MHRQRWGNAAAQRRERASPNVDSTWTARVGAGARGTGPNRLSELVDQGGPRLAKVDPKKR
jgi:hypothetical protein